jgi:TATA-box binding protein (TBP) (component of TFIID and TFIIIB)
MTLNEPNNIDSKLREYENVDIEDISKKRNKIIKKISIGISSKDMVSYRCKKKGAFYNCFVIMFRVLYEGRFKEMHVKIFNTGKMEIPGVPKDDLLELLLERVLVLLNSPAINLDVQIKEESFETVLINSNFNCGFNINRESLVDIIKYTYKLNVSYDPCSYPGIMCKYYYYLDKQSDEQDGRLYKQHDENGNCKNSKPICISFMIFRTGSVLIVGKCHNTEIIYKIYNFIKDIFIEHYSDIYAPSSPEDSPKTLVTKKKIKKKKVVCYQSLSGPQSL